MEFKIHEIFSADRSAWPVFKRHQVAKFFTNFQVNFVLCSQESDVFGNTGILVSLWALFATQLMYFI